MSEQRPPYTAVPDGEAQRIWEPYKLGASLAQLQLLFPGRSPEQLRRAVLSQVPRKLHRVPPEHMLPCHVCGDLTCGAVGMRIEDGRFACPECCTLRWVPWEEAA